MSHSDCTEDFVVALKALLESHGWVVVPRERVQQEEARPAEDPHCSLRIAGCLSSLAFSLVVRGMAIPLDLRGRLRTKILCSVAVIHHAFGELAIRAGDLARGIEEPAPQVYSRWRETAARVNTQAPRHLPAPVLSSEAGVYRLNVDRVELNSLPRFADTRSMLGWMKNPCPQVFSAEDGAVLQALHGEFFVPQPERV